MDNAQNLEIREEVSRKIALDTDDLYSELAFASGKGVNVVNAVRKGRQIFENLSRSLQPTICSNSSIAELCRKHDNLDVALAMAIVEVVAQKIHPGVPPVPFALLLIRFGLDKLCGPSWPPAK